MNGPVLLLIVVAMIALLIVLVSKVRLHAFLALLLTAVLTGLATRQPPDQILEAVTGGFGSLMTHIGIVIVLGVIIGDFLEATGGAERIADSVLRMVGKKRSPLAMGIAGGIVSIPVFCDSGFVILTPIWRALSRVGKIPAMTLSTALMAGLLATHVFVPPTPGPIAAAGILGADLGRLVFLGLVVSVPVILVSVGWANSRFLRNRFPRHVADDPPLPATPGNGRPKPPSTAMAYAPIVVPIVLIVTQSFAGQAMPEESRLRSVLGFIGHPAIALLIGAGLAYLTTPRTKEVLSTWVNRALERCTVIVLVTAAAGSFGRVLALTGVGDYLGSLIAPWGLPGVVLPFVISAFIVAAQGSSTVALLTTASIIAPMRGALGISPEIAVLAIGAGAITVVHANSSYFWVVAKFSDMDMAEGYWAVTATTLLMGITGFLCVALLSFFA